LEGRSARGAADEDELADVLSLGRLLEGASWDEEAALLTATSASNSAAEMRSRPGICDDGGIELDDDGGIELDDDDDAGGCVMVLSWTVV